MAKIDKEENEGVVFALVSVFASALLPVMGRFTAGNYPPLFFAAVSVSIGFFALYFYLALKGRASGIPLREPRTQFALVGIFSTGITSLLIFIGMQSTRAVDAALLLQVEIPYSIVVSYLMLKERITRKQAVFTAIIFSGALLVLFKGGMPLLGVGPLLVLLTPLFWPIGSSFAKRLLSKFDAEFVVCERMFYGALFLIAASLIFEGAAPWAFLSSSSFLSAAAFQGIIVFVVGHIAWYLAIARINLSKATALIGLGPAATFIFSWLFLGETVSLWQVAGLALVMAGTYLLSTQVKSESRQEQSKQYA